MTDTAALPRMTEQEARDAGLYVIPRWALVEATAAFAKLAKRAEKKLGSTNPPRLEFVANGEYEHRWEVDNGDRVITKSRLLPCHFARIVGDRPKLNGWSLAGRLQLLETGERFMRPVPGVELPVRFREANNDCEHCRTQRRRNDVFAVKHDDGSFMQVGSNCLRDFLGHDPAALLNAYSAMQSLVESFGEQYTGGRTYLCAPVVDVLEYTSAAIRVFGWVSRKVEEETNGFKRATSGYVSQALFGRGPEGAEMRRMLEPTDADKAEALETLAWVRAQPREGANDYMHNLIVALAHEVCDIRTFGIACSGVAAYLRAMSREAELNMKRKLNAKSTHVGAIGERLRDIIATVEHKQFIDSQWGGSTLIKVRDERGNLFTWFASGDSSDFKIGATGKFTGTVKAHKSYKDIAETQVSRCKFVPIQTETAAA